MLEISTSMLWKYCSSLLRCNPGVILIEIGIVVVNYCCNCDVSDVSNTNKNSRKRLSSDSLPTLDPNSCNSSKKSKLESKAISALVAYDSDSSDGENEDEEDKKCTILQRLQQKAEMFKQKEMDKLTNDKSPNLCKTNSQPDILDIIGEEVPPDYEIETHNVLKSEKKPTGDIFDILKSEIPPDYMDDITNNLSEEDSKKSIELDSKLTAKCQSKTVENGSLSKCHSNIDARTNGTILDSVKENSSKSFNLIANYSDEDLEDSGKYCLVLFISVQKLFEYNFNDLTFNY